MVPQTHVLVAGASGTLGRRLCLALIGRGHRVTGLARHIPSQLIEAGVRAVEADVLHWQRPQWETTLAGVDVAINSIGIFQETDDHRFDTVHGELPRALFGACAACGVRLGVQVSALGADGDAVSAYHLSKRDADQWLLAQSLPMAIVQPSLIFAPDGPSARLFLGLASMPVLGLPAGGRQPLQPIHVDDAAKAIARLVDDPSPWVGRRIALVGPAPVSFARYLQALRVAMGLGPARELPIPGVLADLAGRIAGRLPGSLLTRDSWRMLERGNVADASDIATLLGRQPRAPERFIDPGILPAIRWRAQWSWLAWLLRLALAFIWIFTAWVSAFVYPVDASLTLLAAVGVTGALGIPALYAASLLDLLLGLATLFSPAKWRPAVWWAQVALILLYTVALTLGLPEFWWHPYGPLSKNAAILALLAVLIADDSARHRRA